MEFKIIDNANALYKQKHYLKNRNLSILEFQMRIMDMIYLNEVPFMERLNFVKIICNNLEEFISTRLSDVDQQRVSQLIHTIEKIYKKLGDFLDYVNDINNIHFEDYSRPVFKVVNDKSFRYVYAGESTNEFAKEIKDVIDIKKMANTVDILYSNFNNKSYLENSSNIRYGIKVPMSILLLNEYLDWYADRGGEQDYYPEDSYEIGYLDYYDIIQRTDFLFRNPYDPYEYVLDFIDQMCEHEEIVAVFITLYRTAKNSKIIESLMKAKSLGKDVYVYIEPTARDNEEDNLKNIQRLSSVGVHVNCNYYNYKVHGKLFCAIAKNGKIFTHVGTGNYNEDTAKMYTDFHLLTSNTSISKEALRVIMSVFRREIYRTQNPNLHLYSSPLNFRSKISDLIKNEIEKGKNGQIRIKCNSLCDSDVIDKLYRASNAGVNVQIIARTGCSISIKENIEVRSKVGRYLEHDRFYIFGKDDDCKVYISSADLLLRNINKRLEILCEILEEENKEKVTQTFDELWNDKRIHVLQEDGRWRMQ